MFRSVLMGIFDHSTRSAFVRSHTDVGREGLALSLHSNSSQRCSIGLRSGLCAGQSSSSTPNSLIHVFMDPALFTGAQSCWNRKGPSQNCFHKVGSMELSNISLPRGVGQANLKATWSLEVCSDWLLPSVGEPCTLCASASADPAPSF